MTKADGGVGTSVPRLDAAATVTGESRFTDDLAPARALVAALHTSPHAHARIVDIDTASAAALPGVAAVVTGRDFEPRLAGGFVHDETILAVDKVRFVGEPVAAVAAADAATAREAARLIEVTYDELPAVLTIDDALAPDATIIHDDLDGYVTVRPGKGSGNVLWESIIEEGDVDGVWAQCDVIVEGVYETPAQHHVYLEPTAAVAVPERDGRVTVWSSTQSIALAQQRVSEWLDMPMSKIRMIAPRIGGGFGGKGSPHLQPLVAALALRTGRPVRLALERTQDFEVMRSRHAARIRIKTGATKDGKILAREADAVLDCGAYADDSPGVISVCALMSRGPYVIPNARARARGVYTNKLRAGAYRGYGNPQASFAGESQLDELAARLGIDPLELRRRNIMAPGDRWFGGQVIDTCALGRCLDAVAEAARPESEPPPPGRRRGVGYACVAAPHGLLATAVDIQLRGDGTVALGTGIVDIGQGSDTALSQICAEALQIPVEHVSFAGPDSDTSPYDWKTAASRITYMGGRACMMAAEEVKRKLFAHAEDMLECSAEDLELRPGGVVGIKGVPDRAVPFAAIAGRSTYGTGGPVVGSGELMFEDDPIDPAIARASGLAFAKIGVYSFGAHAVEAELDEVTGQVRVLGAWCAHDVGRAINPAMVEGQITGGFVQGMGYALLEELVWEGGVLINPTMMDYKIPGAMETPPVTPIIIEDPEPTGPFGAKGVGEPPLVAASSAIANAVAAAGVRVRRLPMTMERVLDALEGEV